MNCWKLIEYAIFVDQIGLPIRILNEAMFLALSEVPAFFVIRGAEVCTGGILV